MVPTATIWSWRSTRLKIALIICLGIYSSVSMRASLSMSIICMVNSTAFDDPIEQSNRLSSNISSSSRGECPARVEKSSTSAGYDGSLLWSPSQRSTLFSATYYGSLVTMLLSGPMADTFGPKRMLAGALSIMILMTSAAPTLARLSYWTYYGSRVVMGMAEGFVMPSANALGVRWYPASEKSTMSALYTSGIQIAAGSSNFIGSLLCGVDLLGGWPLIFYLFAFIGASWLVLWLLFVTDHPSHHKFIGPEEQAYLEERVVGKSTTPVTIPWLKLLSSREVHACLMCNFTLSYLVSTNQNYLPLYFKEELRLPLSKNGLFTIVPFLTQLIAKNTLCRFADHLKSSGKLSPTVVVKLFQGIASFGSCLSLLGLALLPSCHQPWIAVVMLVVYGVVFSGGSAGFMTSLMCIAPQFTGTLFSISMAFGQLASVLATYAVGFVAHQGWPHKWLLIYAFGALIQLVSGTFFLLFGSGEPAEWTKHRDDKKEPMNAILLEDFSELKPMKEV